MGTRLSAVFRWFALASLPLAAAVFALAAGSDDPGARGNDIKGPATAAGVGGQADPAVATPALGATAPASDRDNGSVRPSTPGGATMCRLPDWLPGTWAFSHVTTTERSKTLTFPDSKGCIPVPIPMMLVFTQGSPTYEFTGGLFPAGQSRDHVGHGRSDHRRDLALQDARAVLRHYLDAGHDRQGYGGDHRRILRSL